MFFTDLLQKETEQEETTFLDFLRKVQKPPDLTTNFTSLLEKEAPAPEGDYPPLKIVPALTKEEKRQMAKDYLSMESREERRKLLRTLVQFSGGFTESATLGAAKLIPYTRTPPPEGGAESVARGAGSFLGFLTSPIAIGKGAWTVGAKLGRALGRKIFSKGVSEAVPMAVKKGASYLARTPVTLGVAEAVSDVTEPGKAPERLLSGAQTGMIFGIAGLSHLTKYPALNQIMSQVGGRALMGLAGHYDPETFTKENLPNLVFSELLNTYFLKHGVHPKSILTGELSPVEKKKFDRIRKDIQEANKEREALGLDPLPSVEEVSSHLAEGGWSPEAISREKVLEFLKLDGKTKKLSSIPGVDAVDVPINKNEIKLQYNKQSGDLTILEKGTNVQHLSNERIYDLVERKYTYMKLADVKGGAQKDKQEPEINPEELHHVRMVDTFTYNKNTGKLTPKIGMYAKDLPGSHEIKFRRDPNTGQIEVLDTGSKLKAIDINWSIPKAQKMLAEWDKKPYGKIDTRTKMKLEQNLKSMGFAVDEMNVFMRLAGIDPNETTIVNWYKVEGLFNAVKNAKPQNRMDVALQTAGLLKKYEFQNPDIKKDAEREAKYWKGIHLKEVLKAKQNLRGGGGKPPKKRGSILTEILKLRNIKLDHLVDFRVLAQRLEVRSRIPFYSQSYKALSKAEAERTAELSRRIEQLDQTVKQTGRPTEVDQRMIEDYYWVEYKNDELDQKISQLKTKLADVTRENQKGDRYVEAINELEAQKLPSVQIDQKQRTLINAIDSFLLQFVPEIKMYRFRQWYENNYLKGENLPIFKNQKELESTLKEGAKVYEQGGEKALRAWLADKNFGIIKAGHFLPGVVLGGRVKEMNLYRPQDHAKLIDCLGTSHTQMRGGTYGKQINTTLYDLYNVPLMSRLHSYAKQILNLKYMDKPLKDFAELLAPFQDVLVKATTDKPLGGTETKAEGTPSGNTLKALQLMAHRKKGYPEPVEWVGRQLKRIQSVFFRALTPRPHLWLRNVFQWVVTPPQKTMVLDPRFRFMRFRNLPKHVQEYFDIYVSQFRSFKYDYLFLEETRRLTERGILKHYIKLAEKVGMMYPLSDQFNRKLVFTSTFRRSEHYLNQYAEGKISYAKLKNGLGLNKMRYLEREGIRELIDQGKFEQAALERAKWESDNSQWKYQRSEKSVWEMTGEGESITNLLTWTKGINQSIGNSLARIQEGMKTKDFGKVKAGVETIMTITCVGWLATELYQNITGAIGSKHKDYGLSDMVFWELGGVSLATAIDMFSAGGEFLNAVYQGTPEDRANTMEKILKKFDNVALRQFLPFMKNAFSAFESITGRSYLQPTTEITQLIGLLNKIPITYVDRSQYERWAHAIFSKDPNKSQATRRYVGTQAGILMEKAHSTKNPVLRAYYYGLGKRYERMYNILLRYKPLADPLKKEMRREKEELEKELDPRTIHEDIAKEKEKLSDEQRALKRGWIY